MIRHVARTLMILSVATLVVIQLAPAAVAAEHHYQGSVSELKANCKEVGGTFSSDGKSGICATDKSVKFCTDDPKSAAPSGNNCVNYYRKVKIKKILGLLMDFGLLTQGDTGSGGAGPVNEGGSTGTTSSTSTSTTTSSTTTTTGPFLL